MKTLNQLLFAAVIATSLGLSGSANAQFKVNEDDGIAASPKVRQMLNERKASARAASQSAVKSTTATVASAGYRVNSDDGIAASPRVRQALNERRSVAHVESSTIAKTGYQPTGADGITASPRLRQQLNERTPTFMVAPAK